MFLSRLYISNYRSIKEIDLRFTSGKNVIVGRNNAGKSNLVKAIDLILGENSPTYQKSENIAFSDFYSNKTSDGTVTTAKQIDIWCELSKHEDEELNFEEINRCNGFFVHGEITEWRDRKPVKEVVRISNGEIQETLDSIFEAPSEGDGRIYLNSKIKNQRVFENEFRDKELFSFAFRATLNEDGQISKEIRFLYRENDRVDWVLAFSAPIRNELIQSAIIPSFRDPSNQLRIAKWGWYGKLMRHLTDGHENSVELGDAFREVKRIGDQLFEDICSKVSATALEVAFPNTELHFQFTSDAPKELYKSCVIYIDDGFKSQLSDKGSGIQSATVIGLFKYFTQYVNTSGSALLCVEEPELYLHPHARRLISDRLDQFIGIRRNQVILTTHSSEFIRSMNKDLNIISVRKDAEGTHAISTPLKHYRDILLNERVNEMFFAEKVILCEGFDEFVIRAISDKYFPNQLNIQNVSIIPVGSKDAIAKFSKLILSMKIDCYVVADFDYLLRDQKDDRRKYGDKVRAHESIINLGLPFFSQVRHQKLKVESNKVISRLDQLRSQVKSEQEEKFYTAVRVSEISNQNAKKALEVLTSYGCCIMSGTLEDYCKDPSLLDDSRKLSLSKIERIHEKLIAGSSIDEMFETEELKTFLKVVFSSPSIA